MQGDHLILEYKITVLFFSLLRTSHHHLLTMLNYDGISTPFLLPIKPLPSTKMFLEHRDTSSSCTLVCAPVTKFCHFMAVIQKSVERERLFVRKHYHRLSFQIAVFLITLYCNSSQIYSKQAPCASLQHKIYLIYTLFKTSACCNFAELFYIH